MIQLLKTLTIDYGDGWMVYVFDDFDPDSGKIEDRIIQAATPRYGGKYLGDVMDLLQVDDVYGVGLQIMEWESNPLRVDYYTPIPKSALQSHLDGDDGIPF